MNKTEYKAQLEFMTRGQLINECLKLKDNYDACSHAWVEREKLRLATMDMYCELKESIQRIINVDTVNLEKRYHELVSNIISERELFEINRRKDRQK